MNTKYYIIILWGDLVEKEINVNELTEILGRYFRTGVTLLSIKVASIDNQRAPVKHKVGGGGVCNLVLELNDRGSLNHNKQIDPKIDLEYEHNDVDVKKEMIFDSINNLEKNITDEQHHFKTLQRTHHTHINNKVFYPLDLVDTTVNDLIDEINTCVEEIKDILNEK